MRKKKRGITLILALFMAFLLSTLSLAYITLMMEDSRGGRSSSRYVTAAETAEWGVQIALSYMGRGKNWKTTFVPAQLNFVDILDASQPNGIKHLKLSSVSEDSTDVAKIEHIKVRVKDNPSDANDPKRFLTIFEGDSVGDGPESTELIPVDKEYVARVTVEVTPEAAAASHGAGQVAQYTLTSRASLYRKSDVSVGQPLPDPAAVAVLDAAVRPELRTDYLLQLQNGRSWDVQSSPVGNDMAKDKIFIPDEYKINGDVRITGVDAVNPPTGGAANWSPYAGNLRFYTENLNDPSTDPGGLLRFNGRLSIGELANTDRSGASILGNNKNVFPAKVDFGNAYSPLPQKERYLDFDRNGNGTIDGTAGDANQEVGIMAAASRMTDADHDASGYIKIDKKVIVKNHELNPRLKDLSSSTAVERQDYRPGIPEVQVTLYEGETANSEGQIEINVVDPKTSANLNTEVTQAMGASGSKLKLGQKFKLSELKNGVIYADGGQVVVRSNLSGGVAEKFAGKLQIVASEDSTRRALPGSVGNEKLGLPGQSLYNTAAQKFLDVQTNRRQLPTDDPNYLAPENFQEPPYTAAKLLSVVGNLGLTTAEQAEISAQLSPYQSDNKAFYWPPPANGVEREGNLVVAGDIRKKDDASLIGLTAENFVLLSDRTMAEKQDNPDDTFDPDPDRRASNTLTIDGVLNSFDHSIQLDWFNTSNNSSLDENGQNAYQVMTGKGNAAAFKGTINLNGSILSPYSDVEGDVHGNGYSKQHLTYDRTLNNFAPPYQPRAMLADYPNNVVSISWVILNFKDRTSFSVSSSDS